VPVCVTVPWIHSGMLLGVCQCRGYTVACGCVCASAVDTQWHVAVCVPVPWIHALVCYNLILSVNQQ
jgi:hypothetical protein